MSEIQIVQFINNLGQGTFIDTFTIFFSSIIFLMIFWLFLTIITLYISPQKRKYFLLSIIITIPLYYLFSDILFKQLLPAIDIFRLRPYLAYPELIKPLGQLFIDSSFPSSHMTNTAAILTIFVYYYRKTIIPASLFLILMAFSRMHNGMHYPSDVIGGTIIGILAGVVAIYLTKLIITKYRFSPNKSPTQTYKKTKILPKKMIPMNKKGAIELSINTLVIIIISIIILGAGITLLYNFIGGAEELKTQLDTQTNAELERLLVDQGKQVALPLHTVTLNRGSTHVFGLGILNIGGQLDGKNIGTEFSIQTNFVKLVLPNNEVATDVTSEEINQWLLYNKDPLIIKENENVRESILIKIPKEAQTGQYIFDAKVILGDGRQYGNIQKFYVTVK